MVLCALYHVFPIHLWHALFSSIFPFAIIHYKMTNQLKIIRKFRMQRIRFSTKFPSLPIISTQSNTEITFNSSEKYDKLNKNTFNCGSMRYADVTGVCGSVSFVAVTSYTSTMQRGTVECRKRR